MSQKIFCEWLIHWSFPQGTYRYADNNNDAIAVHAREAKLAKPRFLTLIVSCLSPPSFIHFMIQTEDNNCTASPTTCTGHFVDYPCMWKRWFLQQAHYLDIGLKSNGNEASSLSGPWPGRSWAGRRGLQRITGATQEHERQRR